MWLEKSTAMNMMDFYSGKVEFPGKNKKRQVQDSYVQQLHKMEEFPSASFY
jgi:hypothetical protein